MSTSEFPFWFNLPWPVAKSDPTFARWTRTSPWWSFFATSGLCIVEVRTTSTKSQDLGVLPLTYESGNEIAKMGSNDVASKLEDNQVIKVIGVSYLGYNYFNIKYLYIYNMTYLYM